MANDATNEICQKNRVKNEKSRQWSGLFYAPTKELPFLPIQTSIYLVEIHPYITSPSLNYNLFVWIQAVKTLRGKCEVWKEDGCVGFEESSDEEDGHSKREPDEKLKATVASITQSAIEWKLRRQHSSSSKNASRNNSAANLHPQSSQQQSRPHQPHPHNSLNSQQQQYQSSYNSSSQQQTTTAAQMAMQNIRSPTPTRINMATASVGNGGGMFLVDHTKSTQV